MADIINSLKKIDVESEKKVFKSDLFSREDKIFIFIIILSAIVIAVDYSLIVKFMNILKNI